MKCHYEYIFGEQILMPGCISMLHQTDMRQCTCNRDRYPDDLKTKEYIKTIKELEKENAQLWRIIKKLCTQTGKKVMTSEIKLFVK